MRLKRSGWISHPVRLTGTLAGIVIAALAVSVTTGLHPALEPTRHDREARQVLTGNTPTAEQADRLYRLTRRSLARRPLDGAAHLRLAYLGVLRNGGLDPASDRAILESYAVEPLGSEITLWRVGFVLDNWSSASPEVRSAVLNEMRAVYTRRSWDMDAIARTASDAQGRMAGLIVTNRLRRQLEMSVPVNTQIPR